MVCVTEKLSRHQIRPEELNAPYSSQHLALPGWIVALSCIQGSAGTRYHELPRLSTLIKHGCDASVAPVNIQMEREGVNWLLKGQPWLAKCSLKVVISSLTVI
jgi:hypothetical protein